MLTHKYFRVAQNFKHEKSIWDQTDFDSLGSKHCKNAKILKFGQYNILQNVIKILLHNNLVNPIIIVVYRSAGPDKSPDFPPKMP